MTGYKRIFQNLRIGWLFLLFFMMLNCCSNTTYAPVVNAWQDPGAMKSRYRVQKDDTIYSIAWSFDMDYRDLVKANHLEPPYTLKPGQTLTMRISDPSEPSIKKEENVSTFAAKDEVPHYKEIAMPPPQSLKKQPIVELDPPNELKLPELELKTIDYKIVSKKQMPTLKVVTNTVELPNKTVILNQEKIINEVHTNRWHWPATGRISKEFSLGTGGNKGIDIAGNLGDPVRAVSAGKVVYSGSGLRGYGNLIIIKHSENFLSAYAYNKKLLVKEGDVVKAGTEIGKMGQNNSGEALLHFEIRRNGKPVNPLLYL